MPDYTNMKSVRLPQTLIAKLDAVPTLSGNQLGRSEAIRTCVRQQLQNVVGFKKPPVFDDGEPKMAVKFPCDAWDLFLPSGVICACVGLAFD